MSNREELDLDMAEQIVGGCYVNESMTIRQIIGTDRRLAGCLANAGITVVGSKTLMDCTLHEVAQLRNVNADALVNRMNEYLDSN